MEAGWRITQSQVKLSAAAPVRVKPVDVRREIGPHDHDYFEIFLVAEGQGIHRTNHGEWPLQPGCVTILAPGQVHAMRPEPRLVGWNMYYLTEWLTADLRLFWDQLGIVQLFLAGALFRRPRLAVPEFQMEPDELERVQEELRQLQQEETRAQPNTLLLRAIFLKILISLARAYHRDRDDPGEDLPQGEAVWLALAEVEEALERRAAPDFEKVAGRQGVTRDHFARLFKKETGWTPGGFYQHRRVQFAARLLLNPNFSITEIAYELGYADAAHLSRAFKEHQGSTPREYRRIYLNKT